MKKQNVFRGLENYMEATEERLSMLNTWLNDTQNELVNLPTDADDWQIARLKKDIEAYTIEIEITESAYNYVYENFQKLVKEYTKKELEPMDYLPDNLPFK